MNSATQTECVIATTCSVVAVALFVLGICLFGIGLPAAGAIVLLGGLPGCVVAAVQALEKVASEEKTGRAREITKPTNPYVLLRYKRQFVADCTRKNMRSLP